MTGAESLIVRYGEWGLIVFILILIFLYPEKVDKWRAIIFRFCTWAGPSWRKRQLKAAIQSNINLFSRSTDKEVRGIMPYNMKLEYVKDMDRAELLVEKNLVIVRIRDRRDDDKNLVHAMLTFCPSGLLSQVRPYLDGPLSDAADYTITRKLLNKLKHYSALAYLYREIIEPGVQENPDLDKISRIFDRLDEQGLFTRVILRELRDFGARIGSRYPEVAHKEEARRFVDYMDVIATRMPGEECDTQFQGNYISMGFVWVGKSEKVASAGTIPYIQAVQWKKNMGIERVYIAARNAFIDTATRVAYLAEKHGVGKMLKPKEYYAVDSQGQRRKCILIEIQ